MNIITMRELDFPHIKTEVVKQIEAAKIQEKIAIQVGRLFHKCMIMLKG
jgi:hypothetical protein